MNSNIEIAEIFLQYRTQASLRIYLELKMQDLSLFIRTKFFVEKGLVIF